MEQVRVRDCSAPATLGHDLGWVTGAVFSLEKNQAAAEAIGQHQLCNAKG